MFCTVHTRNIKIVIRCAVHHIICKLNRCKGRQIETDRQLEIDNGLNTNRLFRLIDSY